MLTRIAPSFAVAYWTNTHSAQFGAQMPTRSPLPTPSASRPSAHGVDLGDELRVAEAAAGGALDQRLVVAHPRRRPVEVRPDRVAEQRDRGGPAAVGRQRGRAHRPSTTCTPARLGLSVGWEYRMWSSGSGKPWSSPNGEIGPAEALVSSVSGGPPSSDWPQVGSTRCAFFALRLAMSPPCPGAPLGARRHHLRATPPVARTHCPPPGPVASGAAAHRPGSDDRAQAVRRQHPLPAAHRGGPHRGAVEALHGAGAPDRRAEQPQVDRLVAGSSSSKPSGSKETIAGPAMRSVPVRQGAVGQGPAPAHGPQQRAGAGAIADDPDQHEHDDDEARARDAVARCSRPR